MAITYLEFRASKPISETVPYWDVFTRRGDYAGSIGWRQAWHKYIFVGELGLDAEALDEVAEFLRERTFEEREGKREPERAA